MTFETIEHTRSDTWFKDQSLEFMRTIQNHAPYPGYPSERLNYTHGIIRADSGRLNLPNGPWEAPHSPHERPDKRTIARLIQAGHNLDTQNRPLHPWIDELLDQDIGVITGRGFYRKWGPNPTADPVIFRHDQAEPLVLLIVRNDTGRLALPGGFVDPNEHPEAAAMREALEETYIDVRDFAPVIVPVYNGPVADIRTTAHAWPETSAFAIHLDPTLTKNMPLDRFEGDTSEVKGCLWVPLSTLPEELFGSHRLLLDMACKTL